MPGGDDVLFQYLNQYLLDQTSNVSDAKLLKILKADYHPVPQGPNELQASQNLFWLDAAAERLRFPNDTPQNTDAQLITRLKRERDVIGTWGSEQTSPIYHRFIITGAGVVGVDPDTPVELVQLIKQNLATFFFYAKEMGVHQSKWGLIGQRGTGHNLTENGTVALHFVMQYHLNGRPEDYRDLSGWKSYLTDHGWVMASLRGGLLYEFMKDVFEMVVDPGFKPWGLMVPTHFLEINGERVGHYMEYGTNGNTPEVGAFLWKRQWVEQYGAGYLPVNERVRIRQRKTNGKYTLVLWRDGISIYYAGLYESLDGGKDNWVRRILSVPMSSLRERIATLSGYGPWQVISSQSIPKPPAPPTVPKPPTTPTDTQTWLEKILARVRGWL